VCDLRRQGQRGLVGLNVQSVSLSDIERRELQSGGNKKKPPPSRHSCVLASTELFMFHFIDTLNQGVVSKKCSVQMKSLLYKVFMEEIKTRSLILEFFFLLCP
jgi:hypothetical protein